MPSACGKSDENVAHKTTTRERVIAKLKRVSQAASDKRLLRANTLTVNVESANDLTDNSENFDGDINFIRYTPELASIMTAGGRSKRWAFCLTPSSAEPSEPAFDPPLIVKAQQPTLYMFMDPNCEFSSWDSEITLYIASEDEIRQQPGGAKILSGMSIANSLG